MNASGKLLHTLSFIPWMFFIREQICRLEIIVLYVAA